GPLFTVTRALLRYAGLTLAGTQEPAPVLAVPAAGTPAAQAGLQGGDHIVAIDGRPVVSWNDARWRLLDMLSSGGRAQVDVRSADGSARQHNLQVAPIRLA